MSHASLAPPPPTPPRPTRRRKRRNAVVAWRHPISALVAFTRSLVLTIIMNMLDHIHGATGPGAWLMDPFRKLFRSRGQGTNGDRLIVPYSFLGRSSMR